MTKEQSAAKTKRKRWVSREFPLKSPACRETAHQDPSEMPYDVLERHFGQLHEILSPGWACKLERLTRRPS